MTPLMQQFREIAHSKTCREISRLTGIPHPTIHRWRRGDYPPPLDKAEQVLAALGYEIQIVGCKKGLQARIVKKQ